MLTGLAQGLAIMPGISRSGATISTSIKTGIKKADSATFSFLLAIPVIGGATMLEIISSVSKNELSVNSAKFYVLATGFAISAVVGFFSLSLLLKVLKKGKLNIFAYYLFFAGALTLGWKIYELMT
jgi:undecaprenyl-diphosphatase